MFGVFKRKHSVTQQPPTLEGQRRLVEHLLGQTAHWSKGKKARAKAVDGKLIVDYGTSAAYDIEDVDHHTEIHPICDPVVYWPLNVERFVYYSKHAGYIKHGLGNIEVIGELEAIKQVDLQQVDDVATLVAISEALRLF